MGQAVPIGLAGAQMIGSYIGSRKSKEEKAATAAQQQAQSMLMGQGGQLSAMGMPAQQSALGYYQTLLGGNRAAQAQAIAAPTANITDMYRGAERNLDHKGIRGGGKDLAMAELGRGRVSQLAQLTTGVQPMAAGALGALGSQATGQGIAATGASAGIGANLVQQNAANRQNTTDMMGAGGAGLGTAIYDVWKGKAKK
jgi:hypothetical protein